MKNILMAGFVLLIYQHGIIVEERSGFETYVDCLEASKAEVRKSGCAPEPKHNPRRNAAPVEELKVVGGTW